MTTVKPPGEFAAKQFVFEDPGSALWVRVRVDPATHYVGLSFGSGSGSCSDTRILEHEDQLRDLQCGLHNLRVLLQAFEVAAITLSLKPVALEAGAEHPDESQPTPAYLYETDGERLVTVLKREGAALSSHEAIALWQLISKEDYGTDWLTLPPTEDTLASILKVHALRRPERFQKHYKDLVDRAIEKITFAAMSRTNDASALAAFSSWIDNLRLICIEMELTGRYRDLLQRLVSAVEGRPLTRFSYPMRFAFAQVTNMLSGEQDADLAAKMLTCAGLAF